MRLVALNGILGLVEYLKILVLYGFVNVADKAFFAQVLAVQSAVVDGDRGGVISANTFACALGSVEPRFGVYQAAFHVLPYANSNADVAHLDIAGKNGLKDCLQFLVVFLVYAVDVEYVCARTAGNCIQVGQNLLQIGADFYQDLVADTASVNLVDQAEMLNVDDDGVTVRAHVQGDNLLQVFKEIIDGIKPRELVPFGLRNKVLVFVQGYGAFAAGEDDVRGVQGLSNEFVCPKSAAAIVCAFSRDDDNRNFFQKFL